MSDHTVVITDLHLKAKPPRKAKRKVYVHRKADNEKLKEEFRAAWVKFQASNPNDKSVEQNSNFFSRTVLLAVENHVLIKTISGRWNLSWITPMLRRLMRKKQQVYNLAKRSQNPKHWKKFKDLRKIWKQSLQKAHNDCVWPP